MFRKTTRILPKIPLLLLLITGTLQLCLAQGAQETRGTKAMKTRLATAGLNVASQCTANPGGNAVLSLQVRWNAYQSARPMIQPELDKVPTGGGFTITEIKEQPGTITLPKSSELSNDQVVVVAIDKQQRMCGWNVVADPRTVRAEHGDAEGNIKGNLFHRATAYLLVDLQDSPSVTQLRFYHPRWTGAEFALDPLGAAQVNRKVQQ